MSVGDVCRWMVLLFKKKYYQKQTTTTKIHLPLNRHTKFKNNRQCYNLNTQIIVKKK